MCADVTALGKYAVPFTLHSFIHRSVLFLSFFHIIVSMKHFLVLVLLKNIASLFLTSIGILVHECFVDGKNVFFSVEEQILFLTYAVQTPLRSYRLSFDKFTVAVY